MKNYLLKRIMALSLIFALWLCPAITEAGQIAGSAVGVGKRGFPLTPLLNIIVMSPNGGEELLAGETYEITWSSSGEIDFVSIEYSVNNGTDWVSIVESTENSGSYSWIVPCETSGECLVRISGVGGEPSDESGAVFSISVPSKPIAISPPAGETISTLTPTFVWSAFPGCEDTQQAGYQLRVRCEDCDPNGDITAYDTGFIEDTVNNRHTYMVGAYSGVDPVTGDTRVSDPLECDRHYHWHVRYQDSDGNWSNWSGSPAPYHDFHVSPDACSMTQQEWYVDRNVTYSGNGTEWSEAFKTIQEGIDAAVSERNDVVIVADGTYTGDGNRNLDFGGKTITVRSQNGPDNCIIDGEYSVSMSGRGFYFHSGENEDSVVSGFTITRFYCRGMYIENASPTINDNIFSFNGADECDVPGPAIFNSGPATTVTNCTFFRNAPQGDGYQGGGAIRNDGGLVVTDSTFIRNSATSGGGAIRNTGTLNVSNCTFTDNKASWHIADGIAGGAICNSGSLTVANSTFSENSGDTSGGGAISNYSNSSSPASATIANCTFYNNYGIGEHSDGGAISNGGSIYNLGSSVIIVNCIFSGNTAGFGGAIYSDWPNTSTRITNCTFTGNFARENGEVSGGAIDAGNATITNSIFWANRSFDGSQIVADAATTVRYCDVEGGYTGEGNIEDDPLFVDPGYWDDNGTPADYRDDLFVNGDYHLQVSSPCIDAGTIENAPDADIDGDARPQGAGHDIGADEYNFSDFDQDRDVDGSDLAYFASEYPNITNPTMPEFASNFGQ